MKKLFALTLFVFLSLGQYAHAQTPVEALIPAPTALAATNVTTSGFIAHWTDPDPLIKLFFVDVSTDSVVFNQQTLIFSNIPAGYAKSQLINGFFPNTVCFYRVHYENGVVVSAYSNSIKVHILPPIDSIPPVTPSTFSANLSYANGVTTQRLIWVSGSENNDVSHFNIYAACCIGQEPSLFASVPANHGEVIPYIYERTDAANVGPNFYSITAVDESGNESAPTATLRVGIIPAQPTALAATDITANGFTTNWNTTEAESGGERWQFFADVSTDPFIFNEQTLIFKRVPLGTNRSAPIHGFPDGTLCYYRISAENSDGTSSYSNSIRVRLRDNVPPSPPPIFFANLSYANGVTTQRLIWTSSFENDLSHFNIYVACCIGQEPSLLASVSADHVVAPFVFNRTDSANVGPNFYSITAVDESGNESAPTATLRVGIIPAQPIALAATDITANGFTTNWYTSEAESGGDRWKFFVDVSTDPVIFNEQTLIFKHVPVGTNRSAPIHGFPDDTHCYYRVYAENSDGTSSYSNSIEVRTSSASSSSSSSSFTVYPNPTSSWLTIELTTKSEVIIEIRDSNGNLMMDGKYNQSTIKIDVNSIPKGIYYLNVKNGNAKSTQRLFIN